MCDCTHLSASCTQERLRGRRLYVLGGSKMNECDLIKREAHVLGFSPQPLKQPHLRIIVREAFTARDMGERRKAHADDGGESSNAERRPQSEPHSPRAT